MIDTNETRADWQDVMNRHAISGQTQKEFCKANGISYKQFKYHRYQIIPPVKSKQKQSKPQEQFAEIKIKSDPSLKMIKIKYPNGCECHLPCELSAEILVSIFRGISAC